MPTFTGSHSASYQTRLDPEAAIAFWLDRDRQAACNSAVASHEKLGEDSLLLVLKAMEHGPAAFAGRYTLRWTRAGELIRWQTVDGNMEVAGEARFHAAASGTRIESQERVSVDMPINRLIAKVARPIAEKMMVRGQVEFARRMQAAFDAA